MCSYCQSARHCQLKLLWDETFQTVCSVNATMKSLLLLNAVSGNHIKMTSVAADTQPEHPHKRTRDDTYVRTAEVKEHAVHTSVLPD